MQAFQLETSNKRLALVATRLNLQKLAEPQDPILYAPLQSPGTDHKLATIVEALLGGIFYDSGMSCHAVQQAIHAMWYHAEQIDIPTAPVEEEIADSRPTSSVERGRKRGRAAARMERKTALRQAKAQKRAERLFKKYGHGEITKETMARNETAAHLVERSEPHDPSRQPASESSSKSTVKDQAHASPYSPKFEARLTQDPANAAAIAALQANIETISGYTFTDPFVLHRRLDPNPANSRQHHVPQAPPPVSLHWRHGPPNPILPFHLPNRRRRYQCASHLHLSSPTY